MIYCAIDLELEQSRNNPQTPDSLTDIEKIIQLGIVVFKLGDPEIEVLEYECINIHYPHKISEYIKKLTSIRDVDVNNSNIDIHQATHKLKTLREKYDASRILVQWGQGDFESLKNESPENMSIFGKSAYNVKHMFQQYAVMNNMKSRSGLSKSMGKMGLQFKGITIDGRNLGQHNATADALNTARIFNKLMNKMRGK